MLMNTRANNQSLDIIIPVASEHFNKETEEKMN